MSRRRGGPRWTGSKFFFFEPSPNPAFRPGRSSSPAWLICFIKERLRCSSPLRALLASAGSLRRQRWPASRCANRPRPCLLSSLPPPPFVEPGIWLAAAAQIALPTEERPVGWTPRPRTACQPGRRGGASLGGGRPSWPASAEGARGTRKRRPRLRGGQGQGQAEKPDWRHTRLLPRG